MAIKSSRLQIQYQNVHGQYMSDTGTAKEIAKEWRKRFAGTVGELNNHIVMIDENGNEISAIGGGLVALDIMASMK